MSANIRFRQLQLYRQDQIEYQLHVDGTIISFIDKLDDYDDEFYLPRTFLMLRVKVIASFLKNPITQRDKLKLSVQVS